MVNLQPEKTKYVVPVEGSGNIERVNWGTRGNRKIKKLHLSKNHYILKCFFSSYLQTIIIIVALLTQKPFFLAQEINMEAH